LSVMGLPQHIKQLLSTQRCPAKKKPQPT